MSLSPASPNALAWAVASGIVPEALEGRLLAAAGAAFASALLMEE